MSLLVCIYFEGSDSKVCVFSREGKLLQLLRTASCEVSSGDGEIEEDAGFSLDGDMDIEGLGGTELTETATTTRYGAHFLQSVNSVLEGFDLKNALIIPALTNPAVTFQSGEDVARESKKGMPQANEKQVILADQTPLVVIPSADTGYIDFINQLAQINGKKNFKIPSVKFADVSLAYYISKYNEFDPEHHTLVFYIGKEYSRLIFLKGNMLNHISPMLDVGKNNIYSYDVYSSKILLEMENGEIPKLDNVFVTGEDSTEDLMASFYETFPGVNVQRPEFDGLDVSMVDDEEDALQQFTVPMAVAIDYYDEVDKLHRGLNMVPDSLKEQQKFFPLGWHGYLILPLIFLAAFAATYRILEVEQDITQHEREIQRLTQIKVENQEILDEIARYETRINSFDRTQAVLDSASVGAGVWNNTLSSISNFISTNTSLWIQNIESADNEGFIIEGYAVRKEVLTAFSNYFTSATINSITTEQIRDRNAYKFSITVAVPDTAGMVR